MEWNEMEQHKHKILIYIFYQTAEKFRQVKKATKPMNPLLAPA